MGIVAAGVHHAGLATAISGRDLGSERHVGLLGDGQPVHIGAQGHDRPGSPSVQNADDARMRDTRAHFQAELSQVLGHDLRSAKLPVAEFGVGVEVAAPGDHARLEIRGAPVDLLIERARLRGLGGRCA